MVAAREQGAVVAAGDAADQDLNGGAEPDGDCGFAAEGACCRVHERSAAKRDHCWGTVEQTADDAVLTGAKFGFAKAVEDFGDGAAGGGLDLHVGVAERKAQAGGEAPADGGLARAHEADEHDRAGFQMVRERGQAMNYVVAPH